MALPSAPPALHAAAPARPAPNWQAIAEFYAGRPIKSITFDWPHSMGTTGLPESGYIRLNPSLKASLAAFQKYGPRSQQAMVLGWLGLSTLIHEALHNRANQGDFQNSNEIMENDLGVRLIPDAMQRFFGIPLQSRWGQKYMDAVLKSLRTK